jgi:hypothetical protein
MQDIFEVLKEVFVRDVDEVLDCWYVEALCKMFRSLKEVHVSSRSFVLRMLVEERREKFLGRILSELYGR